MRQQYSNVIVTGSLAYDYIMDFPGRFSDHILPGKIHELNLSFSIPQLAEKFGGTAGNIAYTLSLLKLKPLIIARAGNDFNSYKNWLRRNKLTLAGIKASANRPTAAAYIITDKADNQIAGFYMGAMLEPLALSKSLIKSDSLAILAADLPTNMKKLADYYQRLGVNYVFDPGQQLINLNKSELRKFIKTATVFVSNDYEQSLLLKKSGYSKKQLLNRVPVVITTLGDKGSVIYNKNKLIKIKAARIKKVVDPTGAGDAYRAGLVAGMVWGLAWSEIGAVASTAASYAVEKYGTQEHHFTPKDFKRRLYKNFGFKI